MSDEGQAPPSAESQPPGEHFSETIVLGQWLKLLTVSASLMMLALLLLLLIWLAGHIRHTLLLFSLGGLLAYALEPLVQLFRGKRLDGSPRLSRALSAMLVFLGLAVILIGAGFLLSHSLVHQVHLLETDRVSYAAMLQERAADIESWLNEKGLHLTPKSYLSSSQANVRSWGEVAIRHALVALEELSRGVVEGFVVGLISLYFLIYCQEIRAGFSRMLPERLHPHLTNWQDDVNRILGGFVRGQLVLALTIGAMAALLCLALGLKLWLLLGIFVVFCALLPVAGPFIGAIPAIVAAMVSPDAHFSPLVRVLILIISFAIINEIGSKILYPRLVGAALGLHEVLVLFILFAGLEVGGIVGVLFAAPITALALVTGLQLNRLWQGLPAVSISASLALAGRAAKQRGTP